MNKKLFAALAIILVVIVILAFRPPAFARRMMESTDLVAVFGKRTFSDMLTHLPKGAVLAEGGEWVIFAPDGGAEFAWAARSGQRADHVAAMRIPAAPFLAAGLDPAKLPDGIARGQTLVFGLKGTVPGGARPEPGDPATAFASVMDAHRDSVAYHFQLGHYGIDLGGGNLLEWAADPRENSLDLVFALEPSILEQAGLDKNKVDGWIAGSVVVHDASGRKVEVPKLLKPFDLLK
ncbi:MAG: hypothetical protein LBJ46_04945 [Planctomycetota bacterium]|nr:hypothetical protein [Planctomycetota bacterium]